MTDRLLREWEKIPLQGMKEVSREMLNLLSSPSLVFLDGEVGSGKTTLLQFLFPKRHVSSPTYSILNEGGSFVHGDFYRLEDESELEFLEIPLYLEGKDFFFVEWGRQFLPPLCRQIDTCESFLTNDWKCYQISIECYPSCRSYRLSKVMHRPSLI